MVAVFCERPSANAFGIRASAIATRGFGMSATRHSRSMIECRSGASAADTSRARIACSAILSEANSCTPKKAAAITRTIAAPAPAAIGHRDQDDIDQAQQEHRQEHPGLQPGIATELAAGHHALSMLVDIPVRLTRLRKSSHSIPPRLPSVLVRSGVQQRGRV